MDLPCTRRLHPGEAFELSSPANLTLMCCAGRISVLLRDHAAAVLVQGERVSVRRHERLRIGFREGAKDEWLEDMRVALIALLPACE